MADLTMKELVQTVLNLQKTGRCVKQYMRSFKERKRSVTSRK